MGMFCTVCKHEKRHEIEAAIAAGVPRRKISEQFGPSHSSIGRHEHKCVVGAVGTIREAKQQLEAERNAGTLETIRNGIQLETETRIQTAIVIEQQIQRCFEVLNKMFDACDEELTDPDNPDRYTLDPKSNELRIIWEELESEPEEGQRPKWIKRHGTLSEALALAFSNGHRRHVSTLPIKRADTRELILKTANELGNRIEQLAKLEGRYRTVEKPLNEGNTIQLSLVQNILIQVGALKR